MRASLESLDCDLCFVIGTSSVVYPAAALVDEARLRGAFTVEINPEATPTSGEVDLPLTGPAEFVLDRIEEALRQGA